MMKKYAFSALALTLLAANASADANIYGKANVSFQKLREEVLNDRAVTKDNYELISNKSRFGIKGDQGINDALKVVYQMEWEVSLDSGDTGAGHAVKQRNTYVGLGGDWGTVIAGIHDTPTKMINKPIDIFSDARYGDVENAMVGEVRQKNMIMYRSPDWSGVSFDVMVAPGEDSGNHNNINGTRDTKRHNAINTVSTAVSYQIKGFKLALGLDSKVDQKLSIGSIDKGVDGIAGTADDVGSTVSYKGETDLARLVFSYDHPRFGVAAMYQHAHQSSGDVSTETLTAAAPLVPVVGSVSYGLAKSEAIDTGAVAGYVKIDNWKIKTLLIQTRLDESAIMFDQAVVGTDYQLGKNTKVYGYIGDVRASGQHVVWGHNSTTGIGIEHNFSF